MAAAMIRRNRQFRSFKQAEGGFTLIEVVVSMAVLTIGMVSLLGVFGLAMAATQSSQQDMIAKQLANEAYESIITARNTAQLGWDDVQNVNSQNCFVTGASTCGVFLTGAQQIYTGGQDGIYGTQDDITSAQRQVLIDPGPDGIFGTSDDVKIPLTGYTRTITIGPVYNAQNELEASLRSVTITIQYTTAQLRAPKTYVLNSYISQFN